MNKGWLTSWWDMAVRERAPRPALALAAVLVAAAAGCGPAADSDDADSAGVAGEAIHAGSTRDYTHLAMGLSHSCALYSGGGVWCWGFNASGQLGIGTTIGTSIPTLVSNIGGAGPSAVALGASADHTCAVLFDGSARCWGEGSNCQLGTSNCNGNDSPVPVDVVGLGGSAVTIDGGDGYSCALLSDGSVKCWGRNDHGDGTTTNALSPAPVSNFP
jgi:hypothetical protein